MLLRNDRQKYSTPRGSYGPTTNPPSRRKRRAPGRWNRFCRALRNEPSRGPCPVGSAVWITHLRFAVAQMLGAGVCAVHFPFEVSHEICETNPISIPVLSIQPFSGPNRAPHTLGIARLSSYSPSYSAGRPQIRTFRKTNPIQNRGCRLTGDQRPSRWATKNEICRSLQFPCR
jgi:hypothetical protein